jgi:hypothetical protein
MNPPDGMEVDHINGNKIDNRRANLRIVTRSQNQMNRMKSGEGMSSKFKGVSFAALRQRWVAYITQDRIKIQIGYYKDELAAARAYDAKARELFGEFAYLNFPEEK